MPMSDDEHVKDLEKIRAEVVRERRLIAGGATLEGTIAVARKVADIQQLLAALDEAIADEKREGGEADYLGALAGLK
jgi:hypothetical protein